MTELSVEKDNITSLLLNEDDIPGAKLTTPVEQCTINALKPWLSCRGRKVGGKREELVIRINDYIKNGLDKDLVDPDGGINIAKKRLSLGLAEEIDPEVDENFPTLGFSSGIPGVPMITNSNVWKYPY
ncbi:hypothetical protein AWC38_SpisGene8794 [Stylophora pistillata]|uniref:SAP domain-containing protein n=1 Tax=Stylophora pistillata TaxID=50429 RepID=A0A2B4SBT1_STYPI|nr:hypothetical protein AWC38_SpisGene8794 [Stylophora pistillata]